MISVYRTCIDVQIMRSDNLSYELAAPQPHITAQHLVSIFACPDKMVFAIPYRVATTFVILHTPKITQTSQVRRLKAGVYGSLMGSGSENIFDLIHSFY